MRAVILGSGGSQPTPKAGCDCRVCARARAEGNHHVRTGPSLWLPDAGLLIDTPEESNAQLCKHLGATRPKAVVWTHFHPDHTAGMRVVELMARWGEPLLVYLPKDLEEDLLARCGFLFGHAKTEGFVSVNQVQAETNFELNGLEICMLRHAGEMPMYSLLLQSHGKRGLYNADHFSTLAPQIEAHKEKLFGLDWAVLEVGLIPDGWQEQPLPANHPARLVLLPITEILKTAASLAWKQVVFTHLYEPIRLHPEEYAALAESLSKEFGLQVAFAKDGLSIGGQQTDSTNTAHNMHSQREEIAKKYGHDRKRMREEMRKLPSK